MKEGPHITYRKGQVEQEVEDAHLSSRLDRIAVRNRALYVTQDSDEFLDISHSLFQLMNTQSIDFVYLLVEDNYNLLSE